MEFEEIAESLKTFIARRGGDERSFVECIGFSFFALDWSGCIGEEVKRGGAATLSDPSRKSERPRADRPPVFGVGVPGGDDVDRTSCFEPTAPTPVIFSIPVEIVLGIWARRT